MGRCKLLLLGGLAALAPTVCFGGATKSWRVTDAERVMDAAFASQDGAIAVVQCGTKHFDRTGSEWGFDLTVSVLQGEAEKVLLRVPPRQSREDGLQTATVHVWWLPSGQYLLLSHADYPDAYPFDGWGWLLARDARLQTKVARYREWFVMNRDVDLTKRDQLALKGRLHERDLLPDMCPRWLWDGVGRFTAKPYYQGTGWSVPAASGARVVFAADVGPAASLAPVTEWALGGGPSIEPQVWLTCSDPAVKVASPDGRHRLYNADASGVPNDERRLGRDLWVSRIDGSRRHLLVRNAWGWHTWLDSQWIVYEVGGESEGLGPRQLGIANIHDGRGQLLTKGPFGHRLRDFRDGRFLVTEAPLVGHTRHQNCYAKRLYVIEPLRVKL